MVEATGNGLNGKSPIGSAETGSATLGAGNVGSKPEQNDGKHHPTIDPASIGGAGSQSEKRGRGRPRKDGPQSAAETPRKVSIKTAEPVNDPETIAASLMFTHAGLAFAFRAPELELDKRECEMYTEALLKVSRHYPNVAIPAKTLDWLNLIGVMGACYGGRIGRIKERKKAEQKAAREAAQNSAA